jgi:hypothetical protein
VTQFDVDPDRLAESGQRLSVAGQQLGDEVERFVAATLAFGAPWGDDDLGSLIGEAYQAIRDDALECLGDNVDELSAHAGDVTTMAAAYRDVDDDVADGLFGQ